MRQALVTCFLILACDDGGGGAPRDLGPDDAARDLGILDGSGSPPGACGSSSIARAPWNGQATGGSQDALRPTFRWATARGATRYEIQVDNSCATDFRACAFPSPEIDASTTGTSFAPPSDLAVSTTPPVGRRYFWHVRSCDDTTCDDWSEPRYLDVGRSPADLDGDGLADAVVGAPRRNNPENNEGNVFIYRGSAGGLPSVPDDTLDNPQDQDSAGFGSSVASADVNGDGFADLIVGAPSQDSGANNEGAAFVFHGSPAGLPDVPDTTLDNPDNEALGFFGSVVASAGDLNGDGFSDIVVGASGSQGGDGSAFVYLGTATGVDEQPSKTLGAPGDVAGTGFGIAVGTAGDIGGDGYVDLLVGAGGDDPKSPGGAAFLYCGSEAGIGTEPHDTLRPPSGNDNALFGAALAGGDMNLDGLADIAVGAPQDFGGGSVSVFLGSASQSPIPVVTLSGPGGAFGTALAAGDLTGDGRSDLIVGADEFMGGAGGGAAFVYPGTDSGVSLSPSPELDNPDTETNGRFGASVAVLGDVDGDGDVELIVGEPQQLGPGRAFVYYGNGAGIGVTPDLTLEEPTTPTGEIGAKFGASVALAVPFAPDATRLRVIRQCSLDSHLGRL